MSRTTGFIEIIEASYRVEQTETAWLHGVLAAAEPKLERGLGAWAMSYDLHGTHGIQMRAATTHGLPEEQLATILQAQSAVPADAVARTFQTTTCGTASQLLGKSFRKQTSIDKFKSHGIRDSLGINMRDPTPTGCVLVGLLPAPDALGAPEILTWKKVAAHIGAGFRLLRSGQNGSGKTPDAIVSSAGKVEHAEVVAQSKEAREALRDAVIAIESGRSKSARSSDAVHQRKGLVLAQWTVIERLEVDGRRYFVARENAPTPEGFADLTKRERQVLGYALLGHTDKLIAYELGVADSTVRVLMARAAARLGTSKRTDTVRAFAAITAALRK